MKRVAFYTLGCKVNQYETEAVVELFKNSNYEVVPFQDTADVYVINTCSVTGQAQNKSLQVARRAKRLNPFSTVVLTGCVAQVSPEEASRNTGADLVVGNSEKKDIVRLVEVGGHYVSDIMVQSEYLPLEVGGHMGKTRGFIKIQEGCSNFCSYCIIPYARGPVRSRTPESIINEAKRLAENGFSELVLVGIHLTSYGIDLKDTNLLDILLMLHTVHGISRIRLGSLELTPVLYEIAKQSKNLPKLCPHFHISLQSGCDATLERMKRRYTTADYKKAVDMLREAFSDTAITTDIMVGFPNEDANEFTQSLEFSRSIGFAKAHIFSYSKRNGTPASEMIGQIEKKEKSHRASIMQKMADKSENEFLQGYIGRVVKVLFEMPEIEGEFTGHTRNYALVKVNCNKNIWKKILNVKITGIEKSCLLGELTGD